ncbi:MAG TPA: cation:proton antiporter [Candidatus Thiothrix moscowensis]|uniref:cation:proton antiporter domain-containing protein n=1 Tax=unclassified Thiothrix TaxID=2636184 RepID=UPI0025FF0259|nr:MULTISPECIES: cation:proton antiporter [unclassified Thiothrix]HRJ54516.1 cation:proton antiporter [Candidatus Thiothrix moscowensis]HRJ94875.1 cation:proton antiporter [Candidatus Thiothrix moscowensis]
MEHSINILHGILLLLVLSVGAVTVFRRLNLPPILGYLLVGALTGEHALEWIGSDKNGDFAFMGEVGVVFLLFAIGLEFSAKQFMAMRHTILGLGGAQVVLSTLCGIAILSYFGTSWQGSLVAAGALAMSSTAIVIKQLSEQGEMRSRHGQMALGILLFQDIAVVPFLVIIPVLSGENAATQSGAEIALNVSVAALLFVFMLVVGHYTLRPLFQYIARAQSIELFNITVLLVALTSAWITASLGLSLALGAFLAGMLLSETEYKHQIESEIRPFRDILMGIFFISVGSKLNVEVLPELWQPILLLVLGLTIGKGLLIALLVRISANNDRTALRTGMVLAQGGEFGFALLALALSNGMLTSNESQAVLASIIISMVLSPIIIRYNESIASRLLTDQQHQREAHEFSTAVQEVADHVIICGYRRMGQGLARLLDAQGISFIALDLDPSIVQETRDAGDPVWFADASRPEILEAAGLHRARMVIITVIDIEVAKRITETIRHMHDSIPVLVRTRDERQTEALEALSATVLHEPLEATVMVAERMLQQLGAPPEELLAITADIRRDNYKVLRSYYHGDKAKTLQGRSETFLHTVILQAGDYACEKTIAELHLQRHGVSIKTLRRGDIRGDLPDPDMRLQVGDTLILEGEADHFRVVESILRTGGKISKNNPV